MATEAEMEEAIKQKFPAFPYKPYSIQIDFMNALYDSLSKGGIAMLESPTGTGKTLSIICSALQWLTDSKGEQKHQFGVESNQNRTSVGQSGSDDEPDWMRNFVPNKDNERSEKSMKKEKKSRFRLRQDKIKKTEEIFGDVFSRNEGKEYTNKQEEPKSRPENVAVGLDDKEFLVEEYESEDEVERLSKRKGGEVSISSSSEEEGAEDVINDEEEEENLKIYFCSRTHSQLSQFIKELSKTSFASELKVVCLGSRKNFCINEAVLELGNPSRINERCLELQKMKSKEVSKMRGLGAGGRVRRTKASSGCPMLRKHKLQQQFKSEIFQHGPLDIEDLVHLGSKLRTCPYYGSRSVVASADLVVLPYQSLLSKSSRESLGINLTNNIIIIDEAHNLADSLISMYDSKITLSELELVHSHLERYFRRFCNLLGPGNRRHIQTMLVLTKAFLQALCNENDAGSVSTVSDTEENFGIKSASDSSLALNEFLFSLNIDNINLVRMLRYIKETNIIYKVSGYGDKATSLQNISSPGDDLGTIKEGSSLSAFQTLIDFLISLTNKDGDGRMIVSKRSSTSRGQGGYLKYVMLSGEKIFSEVLSQAHTIILAGGTLQPIEETKERLFPFLPADQFNFFSCGHIIPPENILPIAVSHGPSGQSFDFSYNCRSSSIMIEELGFLLCNLVTVAPEGVVVFFSSFDYEGQVHDAWKASGVLARIMKKKHVFREPRKSTDVEAVLKEYKEAIDGLDTADSTCNGAILFAVVGGKISEGINFSDGMGRCIVMVGLPYPNPSDVELMERLKHIEGLGEASLRQYQKLSVDNTSCYGNVLTGFDILRICKHRGKDYYENLCMKAVNQSIGRAIRHLNDYAAILLIDGRYASDSLKRTSYHPTTKLPQWLKGRLNSTAANYGEVHRLLHQFFKFHKKRV